MSLYRKRILPCRIFWFSTEKNGWWWDVLPVRYSEVWEKLSLCQRKRNFLERGGKKICTHNTQTFLNGEYQLLTCESSSFSGCCGVCLASDNSSEDSFFLFCFLPSVMISFLSETNPQPLSECCTPVCVTSRSNHYQFLYSQCVTQQPCLKYEQ